MSYYSILYSVYTKTTSKPQEKEKKILNMRPVWQTGHLHILFFLFLSIEKLVHSFLLYTKKGICGPSRISKSKIEEKTYKEKKKGYYFRLDVI